MVLPFDPPWAVNGPVRNPTAGEKDQGFPCGEADRSLFNRLFQDLQQAINALALRNGDADIPVLGWQSAPPSSPAVGDRYIVASSPTGAWAGQATKIAMWVGAAWAFTTPVLGLQANYVDQNRFVTVFYNGTDWTDETAQIAPGLYLGSAGGSSTALTAALPSGVRVPSPTPGFRVSVKVNSRNTGAVTLKVSGFTSGDLTASIVLADGSALQPGDLVPGQIAALMYDGSRWQLAGKKASDVPPRRLVAFSNPGSFTWTVPDGIYQAFIEVCGGGGSAGGVGVYPSGQAKCAGGGGAGGYSEGWVDLTPGQVVSVIVGNGAPGGTASGSSSAGSNGADGQAGNPSSFGSFMSANGGGGGKAVSSVSGGEGGVGAGGQITLKGGFGTDGAPYNGDYGGNGGASKYGGGGRSGTSGGFAGSSPGSGGGAHYAGYSPIGNGGAGATGLVLIKY